VAAKQLLTAGIAARAPLSEASEGPDPETRAAARRLVALIDKSEFNHRLEAFAADTDGKRGLTLPGWKQFTELVGGDAAARALFVDMQRHGRCVTCLMANRIAGTALGGLPAAVLQWPAWPTTARPRPHWEVVRR
jgi:hypothetical protein